MFRKLCFLVSFVLLLCLSANTQAAQIEFHASANVPTPGPYDINNLIGATRDANNVGTYDYDTWSNDEWSYIALDRAAQGQTFATDNGEPVYQITGIWFRHVGYTESTTGGTNNNGTWYAMPTNSRFGIRITDPCASGTEAFVLASESYLVTRNEPNAALIPAGVTNSANGTGTWIHLILDNPVPVAPDRTYGYDVVSMTGNANMFFDTHGIKIDSPDPPGNPYTVGTAYSSGGNGAGSNVLTVAPGDRVFIVEILPEAPLKASIPYPENYATDASQSVTLTWVPGLYADEHHVFFGDNEADVLAGTGGTDKGTVPNASYTPGALTPGETYYWRIDEVNDACAGSPWTSDVAWRFSVTPTKAYAPSPYNNEPAVFYDPCAVLSWNRGSDADRSILFFGTSSGSLSEETTIIHDGNDRYSYDKTGLAEANDYYWRVDEYNSVTDTTWDGDEWHFTTIPVIIPPGGGLVGWWKFDEGPGKAIDWSGNGQHGTVYGGAESIEGYEEGAIEFDYIDDYVELPIGDRISTLNSATIVTWVNFPGTGEANQRIFNFGYNNVNTYMYLTPMNGDGLPAFVITDGTNTSTLVGNYALPTTGWHHVAIAINGSTGEMELFVDGGSAGFGFTIIAPSELGNTTSNWLGKPDDGWVPPDPYLNGSLDDFRIYDFAMTQEQVAGLIALEEAWLPDPPNFATRVDRNPVLSWEPGKYAASVNGHELYYSTVFDDVNERVGDPCVLTDPCFVIPSPSAPYDSLDIVYWVVDEVNEDANWPGNVWQFTIRDYDFVDEFEFYSDTGRPASPPPEGTLRSVWIDGYDAFEYDVTPGSSGSVVQLNTDINDCYYLYIPCDHYIADDNGIYLSEGHSMKFYYDNDGTVEWQDTLYGEYEAEYIYTPSPNPYLSEAYAAVDDAAADTDRDSLDSLRDWSGYNLLQVPFYGDPNNDAEPMYVSLEDGDGRVATVSSNPDLTKSEWQYWNIKLTEFTADNENLVFSNIAKIYLGFGNKSSPSAGGSGIVFFDDIRLSPGICIAGSLVGDFDNDCVINNSDLEIFTYGFPGETPTMPTPIINLSAAGLPDGSLSSWSNTGSELGTFVDVNENDSNEPVVETILGKKCVTFDTNDMLVWDKNAPATITSDTNEPNDFTVICEVYNPEIAYEEILLTWAQRGGPAGTSGGVGYGTAEPWGAVVHWNEGGLEPDMGFDRGVPAAGQWHIIGVTYDGTKEALAVDGALHDVEDKDLAIYADQPVTVGAPYEVSGDSNDAYIRGTYVPVYTNYRYTGSVASIKVYDEAIPPGDLAILTASLAGLSKTETDIKPDGKIDFGDLAVMGYEWMQDPYLFGKDY